MLAGGGNLIQVFLYLVRLIDMGGGQSGKADDRIHRSADVVGHVVEEGCFGTVDVFRRVQCVHQKFPKNRFCSGMEMGNKKK